MKNEYRHSPVMLHEVLEALQIDPSDIVVDATLGGAGHSSEIAKHLGTNGVLVGIDQDEMARSAASKRLSAILGSSPCAVDEDLGPSPCVEIVDGNFGDLDKILLNLKVPGINKILFDLGVSSPQLDIEDRGFTYHGSAPLDMRMDASNNDLTAAQILNTYSEDEISRILYENSEDKWARRIAQFVCKERESMPFETSEQLVEVIKKAIPAKVRANKNHPAKRVFQALRIEVNNEFGVLKKGLDVAIRWLEPGGVIAVITYHSIEDRIVKNKLREMTQRCVCPPDLPECKCGRKPILKVRHAIFPSTLEIAENPRARSAKLRVATKL